MAFREPASSRDVSGDSVEHGPDTGDPLQIPAREQPHRAVHMRNPRDPAPVAPSLGS